MSRSPAPAGRQLARPATSPRRGRWVAFLATLAVATVAALSASPASPAVAADPVVINLVTVNDFHGRLERGGSTAGAVGGAAALATAVDQIRAGNPNTVFAAAGDLIGATTFTSFIAQDVPTINALNAAGLEVSAVGNHEFDQGYADLIDRVIPLAQWEYLGANVHAPVGQTQLAEYWTVEFEGVTMGFIGVVTDELPSLVSPAGIADLDIEAPVVAANRVANQLSDGNLANGEADVVVLLVHEGAASTSIASATDPATRFGQLVLNANANIDAIVSGHTHLAYNHVIGGRPVISSGQYGERFSNMVIEVDPDTKAILSMNNTIYTLANHVPVALDDPTVAAIVAAAVANASVLGSVPLGIATGLFNRGRMFDGSESRAVESTIGNFVADVQLWAANQLGFAEIAFMNPGGLRANLAAGTVTYKNAADVQSFANTLVTLTLTGAQVKEVLEQQWQPVGASRPFLKLGVNKELTYVFDPTAPVGSRITRVQLNGVDIDPTANYRVVANSFLAAGGDNFAAIGAGTNKTDTGKVDLQSMVDWFAEFGTATPDYAQRSVGITLSAPDANGRDPGDPLTIDLTALDFTTTEPLSGTVEVSLGGVSLGSHPVDGTLLAALNGTDGNGRATIATTIPAGLFGTVDLVVLVPSTGTTATVPVTVKPTIGQVQILLPGADEKTAKELAAAVNALTKALDPALWDDETHPNSPKVFDALADAIDALERIKNPSPAVIAAMQDIADYGRFLAQTAIDDTGATLAAERSAATKAAKKSALDKALKEMVKGDKEYAKSKYEKAVDHYGHVWKHVQKYLKKHTPKA